MWIDMPGRPSLRPGDPPWLRVALQEYAAGRSGAEARTRMMAFAAHSSFLASDAAGDSQYGAAFVNWVLAQVDVPGTGSASPRGWLHQGRRLSRPVRGCIAVFSAPGSPDGGTVGFLLEENGGDVEVLTIWNERVVVQGLPRTQVLAYVSPDASLQPSPVDDPGPVAAKPELPPFLMDVEDVFSIGPRGQRHTGSYERRRPETPGEPASEEPAPSPTGEGGAASAGPTDVEHRVEAAVPDGGWETSAPPPDQSGWTTSEPPDESGWTSSRPPERVPRPAPADDPPETHVGTGFAPHGQPREEMHPAQTLAAGEHYWFWLEISENEFEHSIETVREAFPPEHLAADTRLHVVLFSLPGGLVLDPEASTGELRVKPGGRVEVHRQPSPWGTGAHDPPADLLGRRLLFPVRAPAEPGHRTMRCSIYHGQTLVQSRLVRARVTAAAGTVEGSLASTLDYTLSRTLRPGYLDRLPDHCLSLMLNQNADGSHGFFFKGTQEFRSTAAVGELKVQAMIDRARKSMRRAAWGGEDEWSSAAPYRYQDPGVDLTRLRDDLLGLAVAGLRLYDGIVNELVEGADRARELRKLMREPGSVQIVNKVSPSYILPAALFYDYRRLDTGAPLNAAFELCPAFVQALQEPGPLEDQPCFRGACPSHGEPMRVCPSGFWGFRHQLGMPVSIRNAPEAPLTIGLGNAPAFAMAVYRDFLERAGHEARLRALANGWAWEYADTRGEALDLLENTRSQVVYFYCHGGVSNDAPYLQVGGPDEGLIHRENLDEELRWAEPRPLVFINGCRTVAVAPEKAFEMVSALVETHNAAGVIGTEITIFEPLATAFAEEFFDRFLVKKRPLGEAMRGARLALLKKGNPLGLVYVPFALAGLKLE